MKRALNKIRYNYYFSFIVSQLIKPFYNFLNKIIDNIQKKIWVNGQTVVYDGFKIRFPKNIGVPYSSNIFWKNTNGFEPENYRVLKQLFLVSDYFFDVGSNIGFYSVLSKKNNPQLKVIAFEPIESIFKKNKKFQEINSVKSETYNIALSFEKSEAEILLPENINDSGEEETTATLRKDSWQSRKSHQKHIIQTDTLDAVISPHKIKIKSRILIKIDVEDFEAFVLKGMIETIHKYNPIIICEILNRSRSHKNKDLLKVVSELNYALFAITSQGIFRVQEKDLSKERIFRDFILIHEKVLNDSNYISFDELLHLFDKVHKIS